MSSDFLDEGSICGQKLLRLVSRGNAIVAELLRLSGHINPVFLVDLPNFATPSRTIPTQGGGKINKQQQSSLQNVATSLDPQIRRLSRVLFDFRYLNEQELFDRKIQDDPALSALDDELSECYQQFNLDRFYHLFEQIYVYLVDLKKFCQDVKDMFYVGWSIEDIMLNTDGKQLLTEAFFLYGVLLWLLEERLPGPVREKMLVVHLRFTGETKLGPNFSGVVKLVRQTGYIPGRTLQRPAGYPEKYFARFKLDKSILRQIILTMQREDIYNQTRAFPAPSHRNSALSNQAGMLYIILFFLPEILKEKTVTMREICDRFFSDNWVLGIYMGFNVDLTVSWRNYKAAASTLANNVTVDRLREVSKEYWSRYVSGRQKLINLLKEGVMTEQFILDNNSRILNTVRDANNTLRWFLLQRRTHNKEMLGILIDGIPVRKRILEKFQRNQAIANGGSGSPGKQRRKKKQQSAESMITFDELYNVGGEMLLDLLLLSAQFEYKLKNLLETMLSNREKNWTKHKEEARDIILELAAAYEGKATKRIQADEELAGWFHSLASEVEKIDFQSSTMAGQQVKMLGKGLHKVEQFEQVDQNQQAMQWLRETRACLMQMVKILAITDRNMSILENVTDLSYAWELIRDYVDYMQGRVRQDPTAVIALRATFLKLATILDLPLTRITQAGSKDTISVAQYYSKELVSFVRDVLEVIPITMFKILGDIYQIQQNKLKIVPVRFEAIHMEKYAQLPERYSVAKLTHQISVFTEGILAMEKTFLGVIKVIPRAILEIGIRKELVRQICNAMHNGMKFTEFMRGPKKVRQKGGFFSSGQEILVRPSPFIFADQVKLLASKLEAFRRSFEYIQDYVNIYGLRLWMEEFSRVINYHVEQEANLYCKKHISPSESQYQSRSIPIPLMYYTSKNSNNENPGGNSRRSSTASSSGSNGGSITGPSGTLCPKGVSLNFMGRLVMALRILTDWSYTIYAPDYCAWYDSGGNEIAGLRLFAQLQSCISTVGMGGVDRILGFTICDKINTVVKKYMEYTSGGTGGGSSGGSSGGSESGKGMSSSSHSTFLNRCDADLKPFHKLLPDTFSKYEVVATQGKVIWKELAPLVQDIGQAQLLRFHIANQLRYACQLESGLLNSAMCTLNEAVLSDLRKHEVDPTNASIPSRTNVLLPELGSLLTACGMDDPFAKIYVVSRALPQLPMLLALLSITLVTSVCEESSAFGTLRRRSAPGEEEEARKRAEVEAVNQNPTSEKKQGITYSSKVGDAIDGMPLVVGVMTVLHQMHSTYSEVYLQILSQYIRSLHWESLEMARKMRTERGGGSKKKLNALQSMRKRVTLIRKLLVLSCNHLKVDHGCYLPDLLLESAA